jgi:hypothetical protein
MLKCGLSFLIFAVFSFEISRVIVYGIDPTPESEFPEPTPESEVEPTPEPDFPEPTAEPDFPEPTSEPEVPEPTPEPDFPEPPPESEDEMTAVTTIPPEVTSAMNKCSDPLAVSNGFYVVEKSTYENGDQIYFICSTGYSIVGNPLLMCDGTTGSWTGNYPICTSTTTTVETTRPANKGINH